MKQARTIMLQGTASDVGKSLLATALCRIFWQDGYRVAPFKSQNMSLNSAVTVDGKEIGRAQAMQAEACHVAATTDMSPILLKPKQDLVSQVIVHGEPYRDLEARAYREKYLDEAGRIVRAALDRLRTDKDIIVIEGAGSPAEINLKDRDIVNMNLAKWAGAPVLLVADIDRGGVFASIVGTLELLTPEERDRVAGFIINKFRGDVSLLQPGLDWLEERTGKPVVGVIPYLPQLTLEDEDGASLDAKLSLSRQARIREKSSNENKLEIAVLKLPRLANFTDVNPLIHEPDAQVRVIENLSDWTNGPDPDAIIIPGSMDVIGDLQFLRSTGLAQKLTEYIGNGGHCVGIGAGYYMMGQRLIDSRTAASGDEIAGFGWLDLDTKVIAQKRTVRVYGTGKLALPISGYVIDTAEVLHSADVASLFTITHESGQEIDVEYGDGSANESGRVWGTSIHGMMHNDLFRRAWLNQLREQRGWTIHPEPTDFGQSREREFDRLADHVRSHLAMDLVYRMIL